MIEESQAQLSLAEQYLYAVRLAYPEVLACIRTMQVAQEMLLTKEAYVHELKASGKPCDLVALCVQPLAVGVCALMLYPGYVMEAYVHELKASGKPCHLVASMHSVQRLCACAHTRAFSGD